MIIHRHLNFPIGFGPNSYLVRHAFVFLFNVDSRNGGDDSRICKSTAIDLDGTDSEITANGSIIWERCSGDMYNRLLMINNFGCETTNLQSTRAQNAKNSTPRCQARIFWAAKSPQLHLRRMDTLRWPTHCLCNRPCLDIEIEHDEALWNVVRVQRPSNMSSSMTYDGWNDRLSADWFRLIKGEQISSPKNLFSASLMLLIKSIFV